MRQLVDGTFRVLRHFVVACLAAMVLLVFGNVVLRYVFNTGITISEEASRWLFVWMTFVGAIIALRTHSHLGMDSVVSRLPTAAKKACFLVSNLLMLYALGLLLYGSWQQTLINLDNKAPATGLSSGWYYGVGIFFSIAAALLVLRNLYDVVSGRIAEKDLIQVKESEEKLHALQPDSALATDGAPPRDARR